MHVLHAHGHEIALHSITHEPYTEYWNELDVDGYVAEFAGERDLTAYFADIPAEDIQGIRIPLLQLAGKPINNADNRKTHQTFNLCSISFTFKFTNTYVYISNKS